MEVIGSVPTMPFSALHEVTCVNAVTRCHTCYSSNTFFRVCGLSPHHQIYCGLRQGASSQPGVGRKEGKNTGGFFPSGPQSPLERRSALSRSGPDQDRLGASLQRSCKRRRKEHLM